MHHLRYDIDRQSRLNIALDKNERAHMGIIAEQRLVFILYVLNITRERKLTRYVTLTLSYRHENQIVTISNAQMNILIKS